MNLKTNFLLKTLLKIYQRNRNDIIYKKNFIYF